MLLLPEDQSSRQGLFRKKRLCCTKEFQVTHPCFRALSGHCRAVFGSDLGRATRIITLSMLHFIRSSLRCRAFVLRERVPVKIFLKRCMVVSAKERRWYPYSFFHSSCPKSCTFLTFLSLCWLKCGVGLSRSIAQTAVLRGGMVMVASPRV
jgi:hypothetical protein